ncbi:hypothetical protein Vretimale_1155 [Volvox reticuliferus]|uniref:Apple domain-containing protein n=1 Tax=Volvox reticuliferus TaxID=1737510 RepID=A0A8J4DA15_9CHLO|nr:hypothetical protein Vretifemale_10339 [Volvox reticuliferus]GIL95041.1 hypothetical protein Vretimale_1155 [Volvox reticuliferus]
MVSVRLLLAGLQAALLAFASTTHCLNIDIFKGDATAAAARSQLRAKSRNLAQVDTVCYEGCLVPPVNDPNATPLPQLLFQDTSPAALEKCYNAALQLGFSFFAISNITACYGGNISVVGWAVGDSCPLECMAGGSPPNICGGLARASVFSMGACLRLDVPCEPSIDPPPPSPSAPPSPPPRKPPSPPRPPASPSPPLRPPESPELPSSPPRPPAPPLQPDAPEPSDISPSYTSPPPPPPPLPGLICREGVSIYGIELEKLKLNPRKSSEENFAICRSYCVADSLCSGFYYKTTQWCYLVSEIFGYKHYGTSFRACKVTH